MVMRYTDIESTLNRLARELNWGSPHRVDRDPSQGIVRQITWDVLPDIQLHYFEDATSGSTFLVVTGQPPELTASLIDLVEDHFKPYSFDELLEDVDRAAPANKPLALLRAGLGSPEHFDARFYQRFKKSLADTDAGTDIRRAALWATTYALWTESRELYTWAAEMDPSADIRREARMLLEAEVRQVSWHADE